MARFERPKVLQVFNKNGELLIEQQVHTEAGLIKRLQLTGFKLGADGVFSREDFSYKVSEVKGPVEKLLDVRRSRNSCIPHHRA